MATRSTIAIELQDGKVKQVYCHWDGYLSHNGAILLEHYSDPTKLEALIELGYISSLAPEVGEKHPYTPNDCNIDPSQYHKQYGDMTTFHGRDRGETGIDAKTFSDFEMYRLSAEFEEYNYILRNTGQWYVSFGNRSFRELDEEMVETEE